MLTPTESGDGSQDASMDEGYGPITNIDADESLDEEASQGFIPMIHNTTEPPNKAHR